MDKMKLMMLETDGLLGKILMLFIIMTLTGSGKEMKLQKLHRTTKQKVRLKLEILIMMV